MTPRAGFTLLEVMVAIVLTSVVALLAYGTASAGFDLNERLERHRTTVEARMIVRSLLTDALRHPPEEGGAAMNEALFGIEDRVSADGLPADVLTFHTRGMVPPLGATGTWIVTVAPAEEGLRLSAAPVGESEIAPVELLLPGVRGLNARVLFRSTDAAWLDRWDVPGRVPAAIALEFLSVRGEAAAAPLIVRSALAGVQ